MNVRKRALPEGWYPFSEREVETQYEKWEREYTVEEDKIAVIVPHAGWYFSGKLAYAGIKSLRKNVDLLCILGGHMPDTEKILGYAEEAIETPLGNQQIDTNIFVELQKKLPVKEDRDIDNTIEIQMPIIKYFFPDTKICAFRLPPNPMAIQFAQALYTIAEEGDLKISIIGSTDLTHYGPSYGFTPKGVGKDALNWVTKQNDKQIVEAMINGDPQKTIELGRENRAACSAGAAAAAVEFAKLNGRSQGILIDYYTSASIHPGSSFVGYAGVVF